jgi:hypothetical protein
MSEAKKRERKYNKVLAGSKLKTVRRADLVRQSTAKGGNCRGRSMEDAQAAATKNCIAKEMEVQNIREEWAGKPKGIRQILYERGLLDPNVNYV